MPKKILGQVGKLKESKIEEYVRLHAHVWEEVLSMLEECNIRNYSIFLKGAHVYSYYEYYGDNYEADMKRMETDAATQQWWTHTHPCFECFAIDEKSEFFSDMKQIFYFNPAIEEKRDK